MSSINGTSASPFGVSAYSTRGGTSGYVRRSTTPQSSSARSRSDSVLGLIPSSERSSSQKRHAPSARSRITRSVHLPEMISAQRLTGQGCSAICVAVRAGASLQSVSLSLPKAPLNPEYTSILYELRWLYSGSGAHPFGLQPPFNFLYRLL